jgi:Ca2+-binding RTX toxin-like protein
MGYNEAGLANLLRSGRGVILGVNASPLWGDSGHINSAYIGDGAVNHAVTLTGLVYDEAKGTLAGFYLADSGRGKVSDMTRFVDIDTFRNMAAVPSAYALYTIEPVKYWQENINGTGNELDNHIAGNRGDNILSGMAGNDLIAGEAGDDTLYGGAGNDTLYGGDGNDNLHGGEGNDILYGDSGNDVYYFGRGDGSDTIIENDATLNNQDQVLFQSGVQAEQLWFKRESNHLHVAIIGTDDGVIIKNHYLGASHRIEQFKLNDGKVLTHNQVDKLVEAMAQFTPVAVGQTTLPTEYQKVLAPIIAASWQ